MLELSPEQLLCNQHLERLDAVSRSMEAKWGINRLPACVDDELRSKWERQWQKLNLAIEEGRFVEASELAQGCVRGWEALERAAVALGYKHDADVCMEYKLPSGLVIRICASRLDAHKPQPSGVESYSLEEVCNIIESQRLVNVIAERTKWQGTDHKIPTLPESFWKQGDNIPF